MNSNSMFLTCWTEMKNMKVHFHALKKILETTKKVKAVNNNQEEEVKTSHLKSMLTKQKNSTVKKDNIKSFDFFAQHQESSFMKLLNSNISQEKNNKVNRTKSLFPISE